MDIPSVEEFGFATLGELLDNPDAVAHFDSDGDGKADVNGCDDGWGCQKVINDTLANNGWDDRAAQVSATHQVQAQGLDLVTEIVERYSDVWHWPSPALDAANLSFFEELPAECSSTIGCYNHWTGDIWLSLDALRLEPDFFNRHSAADVVLHELAHAYTRSNPHGAELLDLFAGHYAGCRRDGRGSTPAVDADQLPAELLADAMAMTATDSSERRDYGYFADGGFDGCLADSRQPPKHSSKPSTQPCSTVNQPPRSTRSNASTAPLSARSASRTTPPTPRTTAQTTEPS